MELLLILFVILGIIAVAIQFLLYKKEARNSIFIINMLFAIVVSYLTFTSLPTNFTSQRFLAIGWSLIAIVAVILKLNVKINPNISKVILSLSVLGSLLQLYL